MNNPYPYEEYGTTELKDSKTIERINKVVLENSSKKSKISVEGVGEIKEDTGYFCHQVYLSGGLNGPGEWEDYFRDLAKVVEGLKKEFKNEIEMVNVLEMTNDQPDDIFYIVIDIVYHFAEIQ